MHSPDPNMLLAYDDRRGWLTASGGRSSHGRQALSFSGTGQEGSRHALSTQWGGLRCLQGGCDLSGQLPWAEEEKRGKPHCSVKRHWWHAEIISACRLKNLQIINMKTPFACTVIICSLCCLSAACYMEIQSLYKWGKWGRGLVAPFHWW